MVRDKDIHTLVTNDGREVLRAEANQLGLTVSAYMRLILNHRHEIKLYQAIEPKHDKAVNL